MTRAADNDERGVGEGDADSLALAAVESVGPERSACDTGRRPSRAAVRARAVAVLERGHDEVASVDLVHPCPHLPDDADELVADRARRVGGLPAVVPEVGAADAGQHDADDGVGRRGDHGVRPVPELDGARSGKDGSTHR